MRKTCIPLLVVLMLAFVSGDAFARKKSVRLHIIPGQLETFDTTFIKTITFNETDSFTQENPIINLFVGDTLSIRIVNNNNRQHYFDIPGILTKNILIESGDSALINVTFPNSGAFIYCDPSLEGNNRYLGMSGMICVKDHNHKSFYWNLRDQEKGLEDSILSGETIDWNSYRPNYFLINGYSHPGISEDPKARIVGKVGDTLVLYITNSGKSTHVFHFHGFHATTLYSSWDNLHIGRLKDTYAIRPSETLVLRIVPDKAGEYPVHEHNLIAVTGNGIYPYGMFTSLLISE
jgi:FtsP/CotA-like multicopper oxidase with cupredoxin domain